MKKINDYVCTNKSCTRAGIPMERYVEDDIDLFCVSCNSILKKVMNTPSFKLVGDGFYKEGFKH